MNKFCYILFCCFLFSCSGKKKAEIPVVEIGNESDSPELFVPDSVAVVQKKWNDLALFIAGVPLEVGNKFFPLTQTDEWSDYRQKMDSLWAEFQLKTENIIPWRQQNLPATIVPDTIFYPFSGPDIPYLLLFYPEASCYYLLALEPVGSILPSPDWVEVRGANMLNEAYNLYFKTISGVLSFGYFKTNDMQDEFSGAIMDGVLPVLMLFLTRTGNEILSVSLGAFDNQGAFIADTLGTQSVEIVFHNRDAEKIKRLYYVSCNLSNRGIGENKPLHALLDKKEVGVLVKSASYLMHNAGFSRIRDVLLNHSALLIQDDSGIPYSAFSASEWELSLYGQYAKPIFLFRRYAQENLAEAYKDSLRVKPMEFRIGYNAESNLLAAKKKR